MVMQHLKDMGFASGKVKWWTWFIVIYLTTLPYLTIIVYPFYTCTNFFNEPDKGGRIYMLIKTRFALWNSSRLNIDIIDVFLQG